MGKSCILDHVYAGCQTPVCCHVRAALHIVFYYAKASAEVKILPIWFLYFSSADLPWEPSCLSVFQILRIALVNGACAILETPFSALTKHLPPFKALLDSPGVTRCRSDSCMFGSIHHKPFRFVGVHLNLVGLRRKCSRDHNHVVVQGSYTKASATYTPGLADSLATTFEEGILLFKRRCGDLEEPAVKGLESQVINSVALSSDWKVEKSWAFKRSSHINILEFSVLEKLALDLVRGGLSQRVVSQGSHLLCWLGSGTTPVQCPMCC